MLGFGIIIPIMPFYVASFGASGQELGMLMATYAIMQLFFAPVWGSLSDRIGRRPVFIVGVLGNAITQLLLGLSTQLWMLFAARALAGMLSSATLPTAMAIVSDSTSEEQRSGGMGKIGAAMGLGMVLGPGLGGWLAARSLALPFFVAAALSFLLLIFIVVMLPESLPPERRRQDGRKVRGPDFGAMVRGLRGPLGYLFFLAFLFSFALTNFEAVFGLYALQRYGYGTAQVGLILTAIGLTSAIIQGGLTGPTTKRFGEKRVIQAALLASAGAFLLMLAATTFATVLITTCLFILSNAMISPSVNSLVSKRAGREQGTALGLNNSFMSLGRIIGPIWAGSVLDINLFLPYLSGAVIMAAGYASTFFGFRDKEPPVEMVPVVPTASPAALIVGEPAGIDSEYPSKENL
jgi:DHA1 family multidrug resistance protein-like MFS transporter